MRPLWKDILTAIWLGMILPGVVLNGFVWKEKNRLNHRAEALQTETTQAEACNIMVQHPDGILRDMELETYLTGVLLAEMPAAFHEEALKAQAVAARTYTWKASTTGGKHGDGSVCTSSACCQAYVTEEAYLSQGGTRGNLEKLRQAVQATANFVLAYDGELIEATYFSSSGGSTESAQTVWGADFPYLQAVSSPETASVESVSYTPAELESSLGITLPEEETLWFDSVTYTDGGGVDTVEIGGEIFTGVQLRQLLGLRSTDFRIQHRDHVITITTRGYGHRVGLSQYGANAMAEAGKTWQQILQHYYPGTTLYPISECQI